MKKRSECTCPCHYTSSELIHFVPCCEESRDSTKEEIIAWLEKHSEEEYSVECGNPNNFEVKEK